MNYGRTQLQQKNAEFKCVSNETTGWGNTTTEKMDDTARPTTPASTAKRTSLTSGG